MSQHEARWRRRRAASSRAMCPPWCAVRHGVLTGEDDDVHIGGALLVKQTVIRLCATIDRSTGVVGGPLIMVGSEEYSLHEAEALIDALTELVEHGREPVVVKDSDGAPRFPARTAGRT